MVAKNASHPFLFCKVSRQKPVSSLKLYKFTKYAVKIGERRESGNEDLQMSFTGLGIAYRDRSPRRVRNRVRGSRRVRNRAPAGLGIRKLD